MTWPLSLFYDKRSVWPLATVSLINSANRFKALERNF